MFAKLQLAGQSKTSRSDEVKEVMNEEMSRGRGHSNSCCRRPGLDHYDNVTSHGHSDLAFTSQEKQPRWSKK